MHHTQIDIARLVVFDFEMCFDHIRQWHIPCFIALNNITGALVDNNQVVVFIYDLKIERVRFFDFWIFGFFEAC